MPEEHFTIMVEGQAQQDGDTHDGISPRGVLEHGVGPHGKPGEENQERDHVDLESTADRQKDVQEPGEHQCGADHQTGDVCLTVPTAVIVGLMPGAWVVAVW